MNNIVMMPTAQNPTVPFLNGGTLLSLIMWFRKRSADAFNNKKDIFSEPAVSSALVQAISGAPWDAEQNTIKKLTSRYKECDSSVAGVPFEDATLAAQYNNEVLYEYDSAKQRMQEFIRKYIPKAKSSTLARAIIELIIEDPSIPAAQLFHINGLDFPSSKNQLEIVTEIPLDNLLIGAWLFVLTNRQTQNAEGHATLDLWGPKVVGKARDFSSYAFGSNILHSINGVYPIPKAEEKPVISSTTAPLNLDPLNVFVHNCSSYFRSVFTVIATNTPVDTETIYTHADLAQVYKSGSAGPRIKNTSLRDLEARCKHIHITGTGGIGKTLHMRHWYFESVREYEKHGRIPVFIEAKDFKLSDDSLLSYIIRSMQGHNEELSAETVKYLLKTGNIILFLDGADEMPEDSFEQFHDYLDDFVKRYPDITIMLSSRPSYHDVIFPGFTTFEIQRLTQSQAIELVSKINYCDSDVKKRFIAELRKPDYYEDRADFCGIPLLLLILLVTYQKYGEVPSDFHEFFNQAYDALLTLHDQLKHGFTRRMVCGLDPKEFGIYLSAFCFQAYSESTLDFHKKSFCEIMDKVLEDNPVRSKAKSECFLYDAVKGLSIMCREGDDSYHFIHRYFLEFLAAKHLSENLAGSYEDIYEYFENEKHGWRGDSVFEMLYSMNSEHLDLYLFYPMLSSFLEKYGTDERGYWTFLTKMYPRLSVLKTTNDIDEQGTEELIDWMANLRPITSSGSFLYNYFSKVKGISKVSALSTYSWDELDIAQWDGNFIVDDGENLMGPVSYCELFQHVPADRFIDRYDSCVSKIRGYEFTIIPRLIDDEPGSPYANLYHEMNDEDFPLRQEFTALCDWVETTRRELAHKGNSNDRVRRLGKIAS